MGNPLRFILTAGQCHDSPQAEALIEGYATQALITDKGYDSVPLISVVEANGTKMVIPPRSNRTEQREYDKHLYKERHLVECFINKIKHYRRIATRYEKTACSFFSMLCLAAAMIWLR